MSGAYSRLYHRFAQEFREIYEDDRALATWVRLLMLADASWPTRPPLPRRARRRQVQVLLDTGLLVMDGDDYTVRGLDAERIRRRDAGRAGAAKRWQSERIANASADAMPRRDEQETSRDERVTPPPPAKRGRRDDSTNPRSEGTAPRATGANPRANGTSVRQVRRAQKVGPVARLGRTLRIANELGRQ